MRHASHVARSARVLIIANAATLVALAVASALNYSSVVVAHATVYIVPSYTLELSGSNPNGTLTANGSVTIRASIKVENPSPRTVHLHLVAYQGWIEDLPGEAGIVAVRSPPDVPYSDTTGTRLFYPAFTDSREVDGDPIPPLGNGTVVLSYVMTASGDPRAFDVVRNITDYAVGIGGSPAEIPWNHWVRVQIDIEGVPEATSPTAAAHVRTLRRIERQDGVYLG